MEETVALIKSCIISKKGGIPIEDLNSKYCSFALDIIFNWTFSRGRAHIRVDFLHELFV